MAVAVVPVSLTPTISFIILALLIAFATYYLTSRSSNGIGSWFGNLVDSTESTLSLYSMSILSLIAAVVLVFIATRKFTAAAGAVIAIITGLIYLLASSARGSGINISVPSTTYPVPPHLGLGAVSLENRYPNRVGYGLQ